MMRLPNRLSPAFLIPFLAAPSAFAGSECVGPNRADPDIAAKLRDYAVPPLDCARFAGKYRFWDAAGDASGAEFSFLRTAVPWYWDFLRRDGACGEKGVVRPEIHKILRDHRGLCAGDAHPENFAVFFHPGSAAPTFGVNDPDDATKDCPVLADFMRLILATKVSGKAADTKAMMTKYLAALEASPPIAPTSAAIAGLIKKGPNPETKMPAKGEDGTDCPPDVFAALNAAYRRSREPAKLKPADPVADCVDVSRGKTTGGSGGLPRYVVRFTEASGEGAATSIVTFKGTQANGAGFFERPSANWDAKERYSTGCRAERGPDAAGCPVVAEDANGYGFHARSKNERSIKLEKLSGPALQETLEAEAVALANLHRANLADPAKLGAYVAAVKAARDAIDLDADALVNTVKKTTEAVKTSALDPKAPGGLEFVCSAAAPAMAKRTSPGAVRAPAGSRRDRREPGRVPVGPLRGNSPGASPSAGDAR